MDIDLSHWEYEHFLTYLYLHAASADGEIQNEERALITERVGDGVYEETLEEFNKHTDLTHESVIAWLSNKFIVSDRHRKDLLQDFRSIIAADGVIDSEEAEVFKRLKHII
jgi:uncharacterized membrane protein YebE (DUF533 family)